MIGATVKKKQVVDYNDDWYKEYLGYYLGGDIEGDYDLVISGELGCPVTQTPYRAKVMVIGKRPDEEEIGQDCPPFSGPAGYKTKELFEAAGVDTSEWYFTYMSKVKTPDDKYLRDWLDTCRHILYRELELVEPEYIIVLGADPLKCLFGGKAKYADYDSRMVGVDYGTADGGTANAVLLAIPNPAIVLSKPEELPGIQAAVKRAAGLVRTGELTTEEGLDYVKVEDLAGLAKALRTIREEGTGIVAADAEWEGDHPGNPGSFLRTIQFSYKPKQAYYIAWRDTSGQPNFNHAIGRKLLQERLSGIRFAGHFFQADLEFLLAEQLDVFVEGFRAAATIGATRTDGGFDTSLAAHAIDETSKLGLEELLARYCPEVPRYDHELEAWKAERKAAGFELTGYGKCPDESLFLYACYDADATYRLMEKLQPLLDRGPVHAVSSRESFWRSMRAVPAVLEINTHGILVDRDRLDDLVDRFMRSRDSLVENIRREVRWPKLNLSSLPQLRALLFGEEFAKKKGSGNVIPELATSLGLTPVQTTDKYPRPWESLENPMASTASTDDDVLGVLWNRTEHPWKKEVLGMIRNWRIIGQALRNNLRVPRRKPGDGEFLRDRNGHYIYERSEASLPGSICSDGMVRTHVRTTLETARWATLRPNLQNQSQMREEDYKVILGDQYLAPLKTVLRARPGYKLVSADYSGAEMAIGAFLSGDKLLMEHVSAGDYDIHSNIAVMAFNLDCPPTKKGLEDAGYKKYRTLAKAVVFGLMYGRGARAIARNAEAEGTYVTEEEAQKTIDTVLAIYPRLANLLAECAQRAVWPGRIVTPFGRYRRAYPTNNKKVINANQREFKNFPFQSTVADCVNQAVYNLIEARRCWDFMTEPGCPSRSLEYAIVLQIHDSIVCEVLDSDVQDFCEIILPMCMVEGVPIYPCRLDGMPIDRGPYYLDIDISVYDRFGEE